MDWQVSAPISRDRLHSRPQVVRARAARRGGEGSAEFNWYFTPRVLGSARSRGPQLQSRAGDYISPSLTTAATGVSTLFLVLFGSNVKLLKTLCLHYLLVWSKSTRQPPINLLTMPLFGSSHPLVLLEMLYLSQTAEAAVAAGGSSCLCVRGRHYTRAWLLRYLGHRTRTLNTSST